jgi:hypothetical protein
MVMVKPGEWVVQKRDDVVVYQLRFIDWNTDLDHPDDRNARIEQRIIVGPPLDVRAMAYAVGSQVQCVRISGGGRKRGEYEIVRTVRSRTETRVRSFFVRVLP